MTDPVCPCDLCRKRREWEAAHPPEPQVARVRTRPWPSAAPGLQPNATGRALVFLVCMILGGVLAWWGVR
jgi:hypothetical protein